MTPPPALLLIAGIQLLLALTFLIVPVVARRFGDAAQEAAAAYAERHGVAGATLLANGFKITESRAEMAFPLALSVIIAILTVLNVLDTSAVRTLSLVTHALFFFIGGFITAGQVFVGQYTERAFARSNDTALRNLSAHDLVAAANAAFPAWLRPVILLRFVLATLGSAIIVAILLIDR